MIILRALFSLGLGIVLLVAGVHCTLFGGPGRTNFAHAHFAPSCGPTDGPALVIYLTSREAGCRIVEPGYARKNVSITGTFVHVILYGIDQPNVPSSRGLASSEQGSAALCGRRVYEADGGHGHVFREQRRGHTRAGDAGIRGRQQPVGAACSCRLRSRLPLLWVMLGRRMQHDKQSRAGCIRML